MKSKRTCSACGSMSAPEGAKFCSDCGTSLALNEGDVNTMDTPLAVAVPISEAFPASTNTTHATAPPLMAMNGAVYWKNPSPEVLARSSNSRTVGGILFIETSDPKGKITVPKSINVASVLSESKIDLSVAEFVHPVTTITVFGTVLSDLKVIVPRGVRVETRGIGILASFKNKTPDNYVAQDGPLVIVKGAAILSDVKVKLNEGVPPLQILP